jgi:hypothetical protein
LKTFVKAQVCLSLRLLSYTIRNIIVFHLYDILTVFLYKFCILIKRFFPSPSPSPDKNMIFVLL